MNEDEIVMFGFFLWFLIVVGLLVWAAFEKGK